MRAKQGHVQYRLLYFFHGRNVAILAHSLTKEDEVPDIDIERAIARKKLFAATRRSIRMKAKTEREKTSDAVKILDRMAGDSPELARLTEDARVNAKVAQMIYDARQKAGLSQTELAERIGTKQGVISRLEDADYEGHSLSMLLRVASALGKAVSIEFHSIPKVRVRARQSRKPAHANADN